mgnify:CR=1 FL=1
MLGIHYRGSAPGIQALLSNEVQMFVSSYGLGAAFLPEGRLKALAVALPERFPALPDVPTMEELGYKDVVISNWWALAVPAGTETEIVSRVEGALEKVLADPAIRSKLPHRAISVMGDGGFWHNGLTSSVGNAVFNKSDNVIVIVDIANVVS